MNASSADIDWFIRRSTEGPDNIVVAAISLFALAFVGALAFIIFKEIVRYFTRRKGH